MAIAYDAYSGVNGSGTSATVSHTCSGSNRLLVAGVWLSSADDLTGVTYNSVSMTQIAKKKSGTGSEWLYLYYLLAPDTGANNIVATQSGSTDIRIRATSYTGVLQSGQPDASTTNDSTSTITTLTTNLTTVADNCWTVLFERNGCGNITASTGTTLRSSSDSLIIGDSNGAITPAGSTSMAVNFASCNLNTSIMASFAPVIGSTFTPRAIII